MFKVSDLNSFNISGLHSGVKTWLLRGILGVSTIAQISESP